MAAINAALRVLGYLDGPEENVPPEHYWHSEDHLKEWWASVRQKSKDRAAGMESIPTTEELDASSDFVDPEVVALRN